MRSKAAIANLRRSAGGTSPDSIAARYSAYCDGCVSTATCSKFFAAARNNATPPISICSIASLRRRPRARDRCFERIEIHDDRADLGNRILLRLRAMLGVGAIVEDRAENLRVQRLDAPAEERRKTGDVLDVSGAHAALLEKRSRSAGRVNLDAALFERSGQLRRTGFVEEREERRASVAAGASGNRHLRFRVASSAETIALTPASFVVTPYMRSAISIVFLLCVTMSICDLTANSRTIWQKRSMFASSSAASTSSSR